MGMRNGPNTPHDHNTQEVEVRHIADDGRCSPVRSQSQNKSTLMRKSRMPFVRS